MKKKIVFALLLAGMSLLAPNVVDAQEKVVAQGTEKFLAGPVDCRGYCVVDYQGCALTAAGMCACPPKGCI